MGCEFVSRGNEKSVCVKRFYSSFEMHFIWIFSMAICWAYQVCLLDADRIVFFFGIQKGNKRKKTGKKTKYEGLALAKHPLRGYPVDLEGDV